MNAPSAAIRRPFGTTLTLRVQKEIPDGAKRLQDQGVPPKQRYDRRGLRRCDAVRTGARGDVRNTFRLYVKPESGRLIGLCGELGAVIEGATLEEILAKVKSLIAGSDTNSALHHPRITVRVSAN